MNDAMVEEINILKTKVKHLKNELKITKKEYEIAANNYYSLYSMISNDAKNKNVLLRNIIENLPSSVYWKDSELKYLGCNDQHAKFLGLSNSSLAISKSDCEIINTVDFDFLESYDKSVIKSGESIIHHRESRFIDGYELWFDFTHIPLKDSEGDTVGVLGIYENITEEITKEEKFKQAQKLQSLGILASGIAHDFNNILTPIIGFSQIAQNAGDNTIIVEKSLNSILESAKHAKSLVRQILSFSHRSKNEEYEMFDLSKAALNAIEITKPTLAKNIKFATDIDSSLFVKADPTQMHQIIMNLITNAVHAMENKDGKIFISVKRCSSQARAILEQQNKISQGQKYAVLLVNDCGCGIPKEIQGKIFDPFFTTKKNGEGTGMGLSVVHGIVKNMNGFIDIESEVGVGSTIKIYFPIAILPREELKPIKNIKSDKLQNNENSILKDVFVKNDDNSKNGTILLVDDDQAVAEMLTQILISANYEVYTFNKAIEAYQFYKNSNQKIDLLLTDQTMPQLRGVDLIKMIFEINPKQGVMIMSGYIDIDDKELLDKLNVQNRLLKPLDLKTLISSVKSVIEA
ncbi:ATP-binding protein [Lentisphaerota bacterium WC36G]|nr:response regulator [Lentisphaerae bacterium WC36]